MMENYNKNIEHINNEEMDKMILNLIEAIEQKNKVILDNDWDGAVIMRKKELLIIENIYRLIDKKEENLMTNLVKPKEYTIAKYLERKYKVKIIGIHNGLKHMKYWDWDRIKTCIKREKNLSKLLDNNSNN